VFSAHNPQILQLITAPNKNGCYKHLFSIQKFSKQPLLLAAKRYIQLPPTAPVGIVPMLF